MIRAHVLTEAREQGVRLGEVVCRVTLHCEHSVTARMHVEISAAAAGISESWLKTSVSDTPALKVVESSRISIAVVVQEASAPLRDRHSKRARRWRPKNA